MKNLFSLVLLSVCLSACSPSCSHNDTVTTTAPDASAVPTVTSVTTPDVPSVKAEGASWSMTLPGGFERLPVDKPGLEAFFSNKEKKELVSFTKEPFSGTNKDYALALAADLQNADMEPNSTSLIKIGDTEAVQVECSKDGIRAWITSVVKGGQGYVLSCGGADDNQELKETCASVLSTLVIK